MSDVGQDSSMEDILASIKRVIAEDVKPPRGQRQRADLDDEDEDDVLELDESLIQQPVAIANGPIPHAAAFAPVAAAAPVEAALVSQGAVDATRHSLAALSALRAPSADNGALEAVVRDMLRPLLKDWLDQRLPAIVEELVAKEVARITGRG